jgi:hypothetical protein
MSPSPRLALHFNSLRSLFLQERRQFQNLGASHDAKANFITFDTRGSLITENIDTFIGEPHQAYIIFDKDVGFAMKSGISKQIGTCLASDPEKIPVIFFHETLHFAHGRLSSSN